MRQFFGLHRLNNRYPALHGLRVLAILGVIQCHAIEMTTVITMGRHYGEPLSDRFAILSFNAWFPMDLFFVMSGFLIAQILFHSLQKHGRMSWSRFYKRRAFRTMPLYYIVLGLVFYLNHFFRLTTSANAGLTGHPLNWHELFYLTNYPFKAPDYLIYWSWSLSAEEHFYLLCPLFVYLIHKVKRKPIAFWFFGIAMLIPLWLRWHCYLTSFAGPPSGLLTNLYTPTHLRLDIFIAGVFVAYLDVNYQKTMIRLAQNRWIRALYIFVPVLSFALILDPWLNDNPLARFAGDAKDLTFAWKSAVFYCGTLTSIAYFCVLQLALYTENAFTRFFSRPIFLNFATIGYGCYLVHLIISARIAEALRPLYHLMGNQLAVIWLTNVVLTATIAFAIAYVLHILIEKPALKIRDHLSG